MKLIIRICIRNGFLHYQNYKLKKLFAVQMQSEVQVCYHELNSNKMKAQINWLWDSNYISAFDPAWNTSWKPITEQDIWNEKNFNN